MRTTAEWLELMHGGETDERTRAFDRAVLQNLAKAKESLTKTGLTGNALEALPALKMMVDVFGSLDNKTMFFSSVCNLCAMIEVAQADRWPDDEIERILLEESDTSPKN